MCVCVDLYKQVIPQSPVVERLLQRLMELLGREAELQQELLQVLGILDTLFASLTPRKETKAPAGLLAIQGGPLQAVWRVFTPHPHPRRQGAELEHQPLHRLSFRWLSVINISILTPARLLLVFYMSVKFKSKTCE